MHIQQTFRAASMNDVNNHVLLVVSHLVVAWEVKSTVENVDAGIGGGAGNVGV